MKEANKNIGLLFDKVTKSRLPDWAKTTIAIIIFLTPLLERLSSLLLVKQLDEIVARIASLWK